MTASSPASGLLPYRISICGLQELASYCRVGVRHAISLMDPDWPDPQPLLAFERCARTVFRFHDVIEPAPGWVAPSEADIDAILRLGEDLWEQPVEHVLIHCHAGVSRSTATAAILLGQFNPGAEDAVFQHLAGIRPWSWPNSRMVELADRRLGRRGRLVKAMRAHHARMIGRWPDLAGALGQGGRAREYQEALGSSPGRSA